MRMIAAALLAATACAAVPPDDGVHGVDESGHRCNPLRLGDLIGRPATQALGAEVLPLSDARALRWIRPGDSVTMDYRPDRLNIHLDAQGRVERFACG